MDETYVPSPEEAEVLAPPLEYGEYRAFCEENTESFRSTGILDEEAYALAVADPETVWIPHGASRAPALVNIDLAPGYDPARCRQLTDKERTLFLSVPVATLSDKPLENDRILTEDVAIIVETPASSYEEDTATLPGLLAGGESGFHFEEFPDPNVRKPERRHAAINAFEATLRPAAKFEHVPHAPDLAAAWRAYKADREQSGNPIDTQQEAVFLTSHDLHQAPELVDELWEICESRFGELGEFHPVSMEESREFFEAILFDEDTYTVVKYSDGAPACFSFFSLGIDNCEWLSPQFREAVTQEAHAKNEAVFYQPEIISRKGQGVQSYSVMELETSLLARLGQDFKAVFETTNRSATYVPYLIKKYVGDAGALVLEGNDVTEVDAMHYRYLTR